MNTHGGLLGEAYIHGVNNILEGVRQIRGTAVNQVPDVDHVMVPGPSGIILGRALTRRRCRLRSEQRGEGHRVQVAREHVVVEAGREVRHRVEQAEGGVHTARAASPLRSGRISVSAADQTAA